jgi:putative ubiquitin-RnfH superfamily antitoxin RatB of RatAB toxin-antitoxin module
MGIFSQVLGAKGLGEPSSYQLKARDRVEIYRPLIADPKEVRRRRAEESKAQKNS